MATISLCMIVKNEEKVLGRCLDSAKDITDEIIIVDTGSTDGTKEIARRYGAKIFDQKWQDDFSLARNFSFSKANMDYIYAADADEVLDDFNHERFLRLKNALLPEISFSVFSHPSVSFTELPLAPICGSPAAANENAPVPPVVKERISDFVSPFTN